VAGDLDSFIVRIWREAVDSAGAVIAWKGSIEHVDSDSYLYFQDLDLMARFVRDQCRLPSRPTSIQAPPPGAAAHESSENS
jgi:hypothetical protein